MNLGTGTTETDPSAASALTVGTASDFIMRTLIMDFREHTRKKLDDILKFGVVRFLNLRFQNCNSTHFALKPVFKWEH